MNPKDIPKTAITTPFDLFEFTRMTISMRNASITFQQLMDCILAGVACAFPYLDLDDIFIFNKNEEEHRAHLMEMLQRLQGVSLAANVEKWEFGKYRRFIPGAALLHKPLKGSPQPKSPVEWTQRC